MQNPYPISGTITNQDGVNSTDATVKFTNLRTNESITITTNDAGEYVIDLANMKQEYQNGDMLYIVAEADNRYSMYNFRTIVTSTGYSELDMTIYYVLDKNRVSGLRDIPIFTYEPLASAKRTVPLLITDDGKWLPTKGVDDGSGLGKLVVKIE